MPFDPDALKPIMDKVLKPGELTTEFTQMKSATMGARIMWGLGIIGLIAGCIAPAFGVTTKIGIVAGGIATVCGTTMEVLVNLGYANARTVQKADAQTTAQVVIQTQAAQKP